MPDPSNQPTVAHTTGDPGVTVGSVPQALDAAPTSVDIPGYEILGELGRGGMGVVYKARHKQLGRVCALKMVLAGAHASAEQRERFLLEARAAAALQHPNIVQVFEIGTADGLPFFSLEYVPGGTLTDRVREAPLPARQAAALVEQLARAVAYAHAHGIVHRDLKPDNVLMAEDGTPKVADFGLAKQAEGGHLTASGAIVGTPSYMAPEQARGDRDVGPPADVYALGAILYRLVTGRPPFQAAVAMETVLQVVRDEPVPPRQLVGKLPRDLETIILACLRKEPSRRYASAAALADDLKRFLADEPIKARPVGLLERGWRWCRRKPLVAAFVALLGVVLTAAIVVPAVVAGALSVEQGKTKAALKEARDNELKALRQAARSTLERALNLCDGGEAGRGLVGLAHGLDLALRAEDADLEEACRWNLGAWEEHVPALVAAWAVPDVADAVALSRDDELVAAACRDGKVRTWRTSDGTSAGPDLVHPPGRVHAVAFLPDGRSIFTGAEDGVGRLWEVATGREVLQVVHSGPQPEKTLPYPFVQGAVRVAVSPDGKLAATGGADMKVRFWSLPDGAPVGDALNVGQGLFSLAFSADGPTLLVAHGHSYSRYDVATRQTLGTVAVGAIAFQAAWSPDGRSVAVATMQKNSVERFHNEGWRPTPASLPHRGWVNAVGFTADGRWIVSAGEDQVLRWWDAATGAAGGPALPHGAAVRSLAVGRTRPVVATAAAGAVRLWLLPDGGWARRSAVQATPARAVAFTRDGRLLIGTTGFRGAGGLVVPLDLATGRTGPPLVTQPSEGWIQALAVSPDGATVYATSSNPAHAYGYVLATGERVAATGLHGDQVWRLALSPDGTRLATGMYDYKPAPAGCSARLWEAATGKPLGEPLAHAGKVLGLAFSPDGTQLLTGSHDRTTRLWDAATGRPLGPAQQHDAEVWAVAYHPDGRHALLGLGDGATRLWDIEAGRPAGPALRHAAGVNRVAFLADARLALTCSADATARLWHLATGAPVGPALAHPKNVGDACVAPDGRWVGTACDDGVGRAWPVPVPLTEPADAVRRHVEARTNLVRDGDASVRVLSPAEWAERAGRPAALPPPSPPAAGPPVVVRFAGEGEHRPATPEQVRAWVAALTTEDFAEAMRGLSAAGPDAVPELERAEASAEGPARERLRQVLAHLDRVAATTPRRVTLRLDRVPLPEAVAVLAKESGLPLAVGPGVDRVAVSLDLKGVPAWQAVDEFRRQAGLGVAFQNGKLELSPGKAAESGLIAYPGPFRLQVSGAYQATSRALGDQRFAAVPPQVVVVFNLYGGPGGRVVGVSQPRYHEARTDAGEILEPLPGAVSSTFLPAPLAPQLQTFAVSFKPPTRPARSLSLRGTLPIQVGRPAGSPTEVADLRRRLNQIVPLADGGYLVARTLQLGTPGSVVALDLVAPRGSNFDPRLWSASLVEADGRTTAATVSGSPRGGPPLAWPDDLLWLPSAGEVPWAALALRPRGPAAVGQLMLHFPTPTVPGPGVRLRLTRLDRETVELPFGFKDVPLP